MPESKRAIGSDLAKLDATTDEEIARQIAEDPDTAPELTDEELAEAEVWHGDKFIRQVGRPKGSGKKEQVTLRLDRDILARFRADGPGWQTRLNEALREPPSAVRVPRKIKQILDQAEAIGITSIGDLEKMLGLTGARRRHRVRRPSRQPRPSRSRSNRTAR